MQVQRVSGGELTMNCEVGVVLGEIFGHVRLSWASNVPVISGLTTWILRSY